MLDSVENLKAKAVIWDMDGVIVDTGRYHFRAWQEAFRKRGVTFTEEAFRRNFGQRNDTIVRVTLGKDTPQTEIDAITREKESYFRSIVKDNIRPLPGAVALLKSLAENGFKVGLASSAPVENIELLTTTLGIRDCFQAIVSGREVAEGKPNPQGYLLAAQKLGVAPKNCVVIEDAVAGLAGAKRAGMHCVAVTTTHPRTSLAEADLIVDTLEKVSIADLERLING